MYTRYTNGFGTPCHQFSGEDEIVFTTILCVLSKIITHTRRLAEVENAICHFRDNGHPVHDWLYARITHYWGDGCQHQPEMLIQFPNDSAEPSASSAVTAIRRRHVWNAVMAELGLPDRVEIDGDDTDVPDLPTVADVQRLVDQVMGPTIRDQLRVALEPRPADDAQLDMEKVLARIRRQPVNKQETTASSVDR